MSDTEEPTEAEVVRPVDRPQPPGLPALGGPINDESDEARQHWDDAIWGCCRCPGL